MKYRKSFDDQIKENKRVIALVDQIREKLRILRSRKIYHQAQYQEFFKPLTSVIGNVKQSDESIKKWENENEADDEEGKEYEDVTNGKSTARVLDKSFYKDNFYGIRWSKGRNMIGHKTVNVKNDKLIVEGGRTYQLTPGFKILLTQNKMKHIDNNKDLISENDRKNYFKLLKETDTLKDYNGKIINNGSKKFQQLIKPNINKIYDKVNPNYVHANGEERKHELSPETSPDSSFTEPSTSNFSLGRKSFSARDEYLNAVNNSRRQSVPTTKNDYIELIKNSSRIPRPNKSKKSSTDSYDNDSTLVPKENSASSSSFNDTTVIKKSKTSGANKKPSTSGESKKLEKKTTGTVASTPIARKRKKSSGAVSFSNLLPNVTTRAQAKENLKNPIPRDNDSDILNENLNSETVLLSKKAGKGIGRDKRPQRHHPYSRGTGVKIVRNKRGSVNVSNFVANVNVLRKKMSKLIDRLKIIDSSEAAGNVSNPEIKDERKKINLKMNNLCSILKSSRS